MEKQDDKTLGQFLKEYLLKNNLDIQALHEKTKISKKYLNIIINDDYENYPAKVYLRGFLKEIAKVLNIDFSIIENNYLAKLNLDKDPEITPKYESIFEIENRKNKFITPGIVIVVFIIFILGYFFLKPSHKVVNNEIEKQEVKNVVKFKDKEKKEIVKVQKETKNDNNSIKNKLIVKKSVKKKNSNKIKHLEILAKELTWVRVTMDNKTKKTYFMQKGENKTFEAKKFFKIDTGNAGGIDLILNGKKLAPIGKRGEVKHIILK